MPLEIRELVIKVTIEEKMSRQSEDKIAEKNELKKAVVKECLEIIMAKLEQITDR